MKLRGPLQVVLNLTNRCNLRCLHCFYESGVACGKNELEDDEIRQLVEEIIELKPFNLCFFGGEPLLRPDLLFECSRRLTTEGIRVNVITNGFFIDETMAKSLKAAGVRDIEISIDGACGKTHDYMRGIPGSFARAIKAFEHLMGIGFPEVEASFVAARFNIPELGALVRQLDDLGVPLLFIRPMLILGFAKKNVGKLLPKPLQYRQLQQIISQCKADSTVNIRMHYYDPLSHLLDYPKRTHFTGVDIRADGSLVLSPHLQIEIGNVRRHSIREYWQAGLHQIWRHPRINHLLESIYCHRDVQHIHEDIEQHHFDLIQDNTNV